MPTDYSKAKVYKIYSNLDELKDQCYVGATCKTLAQRLATHKYTSKYEKNKNTCNADRCRKEIEELS